MCHHYKPKLYILTHRRVDKKFKSERRKLQDIVIEASAMIIARILCETNDVHKDIEINTVDKKS